MVKTYNSFEKDHKEIEKSIGKPYSQQPGRKAGKGTGYIVSKQSIKEITPSEEVTSYINKYFSRKPMSEDEVNYNSYTLDLDFVSAGVVSFLNKLNQYDSKDLYEDQSSGFSENFKKETPQYFIMNKGNKSYLIDTQGYNYARYVSKLGYPWQKYSHKNVSEEHNTKGRIVIEKKSTDIMEKIKNLVDDFGNLISENGDEFMNPSYVEQFKNALNKLPVKYKEKQTRIVNGKAVVESKERIHNPV